MKVLVVLAEGFEEIEAVTIVDVLRRADVKVILAGLQAGSVKGSNGVVIIPDTELEKVKTDTFDMIVLPGGLPGTTNLGNDERVIQMLQSMQKKDKYVAAICAAPTVLGKAGILADKKATCYPALLSQLKAKTVISNQKVVVDGKVITSQGPATALEFAYQLVSVLVSPSKAEELKKGMLYI